MTIVKTFGWILLSLFVASVIAVSVLLLAPKTYFGLVQSTVKSNTGYEITVEELQVDLFPPRFEGAEIRLNNPNALSDQNLLSVKQLIIHLDAFRYMNAAPTWWKASLSGVNMRAVNQKNGTNNWQALDAQSAANNHQEEAKSKDAQASSDMPRWLFKFSSIEITNLDFSRTIISNTTDSEIHALNVSQLRLDKDAEERLLITLTGNYRDKALTANGTLALPQSNVAREIDFQASLFGNDIQLKGTVGSDGISPGEASYSVQINELTTIGNLLGQDLRLFAPIDLVGSLKAPKQGQWSLTAEGQLGGRDLSLATTAIIEPSTYMLEAFSLQFADSAIAANGVLDISEQSLRGKLRSQILAVDQLLTFANKGDEPASVSNLNANLERLRQWNVDVDVTIDDMIYQGYRAHDLNIAIVNQAERLTATGNLGGLVANGALAQTATEDTDLASSGAQENTWRLVSPITANIQLVFDQNNQAGSWPVTATFNTEGISGNFESVLFNDITDLSGGNITASVENFSALEGFDTAKWTGVLPVVIDINLKTEQSELFIDPLTIEINNTAITGKISINRNERPISISGELHAPKVDLNNISTTTVGMFKDKGKAIDQDSGRVFGDEPIDWSMLYLAKLDLSLTLDELHFNHTDFRDVKTQVLLSNGKLNIEPFDANLSQGKVRGYARVTQINSSAEIEGRLNVMGLAPADLGQKDGGLIDGGEIDVLLDLRASGNTPHELASSLDGEIALEIQRATIRNNLFEVLGSDILMQTVNLINPFTHRDETTELECAAAYFKAESGVLTSPDQLVIETSKIKIRGGGSINLNDETLRIDFVPTPRDGVGISLSNLSSMVRLGGTLGNPQPVADASGILKASATIGAAIATGGLSLLGKGLFDRMRDSGTTCGKIFETLPEQAAILIP